MFKYLVRKFRNRLKESTTESKPPKHPPDPVISKSSDQAARPEKPLTRGSGEKRKSPGSRRPAKPKKARVSWDVSQFQVPEKKGETRFHDLDLPVKIMHAIADLGFSYCTPIQTEMLPKALAGSDTTGKAQTGSGRFGVRLGRATREIGACRKRISVTAR